MKVTICTVAWGGWYPRGVARMIEQFSVHSPGFEIKAWVNILPLGAPPRVVQNGYDYTGYCAKPWALLNAMQAGADVAILMDAAFYPIRPIHPLVDFIAREGYYFCKNGNYVGEWASDVCLDTLGVFRADAMAMEEISSYCVGLNMHRPRCVELLEAWCAYATDRVSFPGCHTNVHSDPLVSGRNPGSISADPRVKGHRHDQTVLSIVAHKLGMLNWCERPRFTAYAGSQTDATVLVNQGMGS